MPKLVVGYAELGNGKLKKGKGFLQPNFGVGPNPFEIHGQTNCESGAKRNPGE